MQKIYQLLELPFRYKPWKTLHLRYIANDIQGVSSQPRQADFFHLRATLDWLCRAQDIRRGKWDEGGVSAGWSFEDGWLPSYPETSGYIVETFITASKLLGQPYLNERAKKILDWELSIQNSDGSFPGHFGEPESKPVIFNTGQIMHGLVEGYLQYGSTDCLESALKAGKWMIEQQDEDGCWRRSVHNDTPHTYNTRAAWALLRTARAANDKTLEQAAVKNLEWALTQQTESGWFKTNAFTPDRSPFTHTIAYAIRGILESGLILGSESFIDSALKAATAIAKVQRGDGWLAGTLDDDWSSTARYCCLTGVAQMCIIWHRAADECNATKLKDSARRGIDYLKSNHHITGKKDPKDGGIAGSTPIWGGYSRFEFPNWAAKFFADALMMNMTQIAIPTNKQN